MKIYGNEDGKGDTILLLDKKEGQALVNLLDALLKGEKINKQSNSYKLAKKVYDDLPVW